MIATIAAAALVLAQAQPIPKGAGQCPSGYTDSGGYCNPMPDAPRAVPKVGQCPSNWRQSGNACVEIKPQNNSGKG